MTRTGDIERHEPFPGDYQRAARITARRVELGLSISQLAERSCIAAMTLYELEQAAPIRISAVGALARALDVEMTWLLTGE
ncbi:MAG: helix-turn-helix transcriptional regulator [Burkholderia sp.]